MTNEINYETLRHKYLIEGQNLNEHEMSYLFALLDNDSKRIELARKYVYRLQSVAITYRDDLSKIDGGAMYIIDKCEDIADILAGVKEG